MDDETVTIPRLGTGPQIVGQPLLDGTLYTLRLTFNQRDRRWYLAIGDVAGVMVVQGLRVTCGWLLAPFDGNPALPPGQLFVEDARGLGEAPTREAWHDWATMFYRPVALRASVAGTADEVF
jgi:hypothetical protein